MRYKNNPGNIRYNPNLKGVLGNNNGFCEFQSLGYGLAAIQTILETYYTRYALKTISQIISRYAPANENQTDYYIYFVANLSGFTATQTLAFSDLPKLIPAIIKMETGTIMNNSQIAMAIQNKSISSFVNWILPLSFVAIGFFVLRK